MSARQASGAKPLAPSVFINYRVGDGDFAAATIRHELAARLGEGVIWSERSILPGERWQAALTDAVRKSQVMIVIIGPGWLAAADEHGLRRLDRKTDWVRREIEAAAQAGTAIIPVLLPGAPLATSDQLPASLATLAHRQALQLDPAHMASGINMLVDAVERLLSGGERHADTEPTDSPSPTRSEVVAAMTESPRRGRRSPGSASVRIRRDEVPSGPIRDFFDRLHELHRWAGEPSTRSIANGIGKGVISHVTVYSALRGPQVPRWGHVELIVEALDGDIDVFRQAWVMAREAEDELRSHDEAES